MEAISLEQGFGESLDGRTPASITEAAVFTDWAKEVTKITVRLPKSDVVGKAMLVVPQGIHASSPAPSLGGEHSDLVLAADRGELEAILTPGTRSLWVQQGEGKDAVFHRIDLPTPTLMPGVAAFQYPDFKEGLVVMVSAKGVLPGFSVEYAFPNTGGSEPTFLTMTDEEGSLPRVADVYQDRDGDHLRIVVGFAAAGCGDCPLLLRVRNPDGSQSNTITIKRQGDRIEKTGAPLVKGSQRSATCR